LIALGAQRSAGRRCDLWRDATQGVAGEGPASAALMFVSEQPGGAEDLAGRPLHGPAGQRPDRALEEAAEITACRQGLSQELAQVRARVVATRSVERAIRPRVGCENADSGFLRKSRSNHIESITIYDFGLIQSKIIVI
jgi:hypothetical protein